MIHKLLLFGLPAVLEAHEIVVVPRSTLNKESPTRVARQRPRNHAPVNAIVGLRAEKAVEIFAALNRKALAARAIDIEEEG